MHQKHPPAKTAVFKCSPAGELPAIKNNTGKNIQGNSNNFVFNFILEQTNYDIRAISTVPTTGEYFVQGPP
tara:strand:- start:817 stop:1029 length:213 start_codon:yes stop_codon:yes gene_type:complete